MQASEAGLVQARCQAPGLARSSYYYQPRGETALNLTLMRLLDQEFTRHNFKGVLGLRDHLRLLGHQVNKKRLRRLVRLMGQEPVYSKDVARLTGTGYDAGKRLWQRIRTQLRKPARAYVSVAEFCAYTRRPDAEVAAALNATPPPANRGCRHLRRCCCHLLICLICSPYHRCSLTSVCVCPGPM